MSINRFKELKRQVDEYFFMLWIIQGVTCVLMVLIFIMLIKLGGK